MSTYIGRRVTIRDALGDWWNALCIDITEEVGVMHYKLRLNNGDTLMIPIEDVTGILQKRDRAKKQGNVIKFPLKKPRKVKP